ncbi:hypothetical protein [Nocardioides ferulae]|uniref:hypothetical protein n=1 Tax=Nocardioides ferulae TaxID=2340821 RepID=UPI001F0C777B|nr:hypothetical protein [Nocardioides ferulae]
MTDAAPDALPDAGRLAWWGTAWLRGHVVADLMVDAVIGGDATHTVVGLAALLGGDPTAEPVAEPLVTGLGRLRVEGARSLGASFPVEGDPVGLGGPPAFNHAALEEGRAIVALLDGGLEVGGVGLVPVRTGAAVAWVAHRAERRQLPDVGEADRALRAALLQTADELAALDVARWRPEVADRLMDLRHRDRLTAPEGVPARCVELAARGLQALEIAELALEDDGGAVTAQEMERRRSALVPLERAGRRALTAACSPEVWPPD